MKLTELNSPDISVEIVCGSRAFANACASVTMTLAMSAACSAVQAAPDTKHGGLADTPTPVSTAQAFARAAPADSAALKTLNGLMSNQKPVAEPVSAEQSKTLQYGIYPPVKTRVLIDGKTQTHWTLHPFDLVKLAKDAASHASKLEGVAVDPAKIGAIMIAESSLVARTGWSSNGKTPSLGLGQLEPNTAKALNVTDANDPWQNAVAVGRLVAQAQRFANSNKNVNEAIAVSLAYNTSTALRRSLVNQYGKDLTLDKLPQPTQHHVKNMAYGVQLMTKFSNLKSQHDVSNRVSVQKQAFTKVSFSTKDSNMMTSEQPKPTTKALFAGMATDQNNSARLEHNQKALEQQGHPQPMPMTSKGLETMRRVVADKTKQAETAKMVDARIKQPDSLSMMMRAAMLMKLPPQVALAAVAMQGAATAAMSQIKSQLSDVVNSSAGRNVIVQGLRGINEQASRVMNGERERFAERQALRNEYNNQPRPA